MAGDWGKFNWEDPFNLDDQLNDEERLVRDTAAAYAQEKRSLCSRKTSPSGS